MSLSVDTLLVVSLMMAVFAAVSTVGSSLILGVSFERLRAGFETLKKQTAFFSDAIHKLDQRVDGVEKQGNYFFEAITKLEEDAIAKEPEAPVADLESPTQLIVAGKEDTMRTGADNLLTASGFVSSGENRISVQDEHRAEPGYIPSFH